jgi:hypothetical protein
MSILRGRSLQSAGLVLMLIAVVALGGGRPAVAGPLGTHGQIAFDALGQIYVYDLDASTMTALTSSGTNSGPAWAPGGDWLAYTHYAGADAPGRIYRVRADGTGAGPASAGSGDENFPAYGPDGALYFVRTTGAGATANIAVVRRDTSGTEQVIRNESTGLCVATDLSIGPDGTPALSFNCGHGKYVYLIPSSGELVDATVGASPAIPGCAVDGVWARTGRQLLLLVQPGCGFTEPAQPYLLNLAATPPASQVVPLPSNLDGASGGDWSPDAAHLVLSGAQGEGGIEVTDLAGNGSLVSARGHDPAWRPATGPTPPGMPSTGQEMPWPGALAVLGIGLLLLGGALRRWQTQPLI